MLLSDENYSGLFPQISRKTAKNRRLFAVSIACKIETLQEQATSVLWRKKRKHAMNFVTAKAALYVGHQGDFTEIRDTALDYCQKHDYSLEYVYQDTGSTQPVLHSVREAMEEGAFHILLIPSVEHIYGNQLGQTLNFLIDAQEAHIDIVCLEPIPTNLYTQRLAIVPQSIAQATNLEEVVRCLRYR